MKSFKQVLGGDVRQYGMVIALVALVAFFNWRTDGNVLTQVNVSNIINQNSYILVMAIGMVMVIVIGQIDLSVGSVAAVVAIVVAKSIETWGIPWWLGILLGLAVGIVIGAWQGFWLAYVGVPGFITTLAGMMLFRGVQMYIGKSQSVPVPKEIQFIGGGKLPHFSIFGLDLPINASTLILGIVAAAALVWGQWRKRARQAKLNQELAPLWTLVVRMVILVAVIGYITYLFGVGSTEVSFPMAGLILAGLTLIYQFITQRTVLGRNIYAVGGNRAAAQLSGVNTRHTYFFTMANMSFLAAVAAVLFAGRQRAASGQDGTMWELDAIAAVFIGGAAVSGGIGTVVGSIIGGLVMAVLNNGLYLIGASADVRQMIKGLVLLAAVAFDIYNKTQGKPSIIGMIQRTFGGKKSSEQPAEKLPASS